MDVACKIRWFFLVFGMVYFLESIGGFYMTTAIVFIEKQFQIPSGLSGTMVSAGDFAYIPVVIFTAYFGGKGNRAKWIGVGCMLIAIANFLIASSNFLFPRAEFHQNMSDILSANFSQRVINIREYEFNYTKANESSNVENDVRLLTTLPYEFCDVELNQIRYNKTMGDCEANPPSIGPFLMIFGGLLVLGVGRTMPFSLGLPLMDDNVKKSNLPIYFAIMFLAKILGPTIGLAVGAVLNKVYYNFKPPQGLSPRDPMWIGCWWLGFLIFGAVLFFPSLALYLFPSDDISAKGEEEIVAVEHLSRAEREKLKSEDGEKKEVLRLNLYDKHKKESSHLSASEEFKEFLGTMKGLLCVPIYVGATFGRILDVLAFKGFFVFLSKYVQLQFDMPQHKIQQFIAVMGVLGFAAGVGVGSTLMKKFNMQGRKAATFVAMCSVCAALLSFVNGSIGCESVTSTIAKQGKLNNFTYTSCDSSCICDDAQLYPVCDIEGNAFYSPCHAGCRLEGKQFNVFYEGKDNSMFNATTAENLIFDDCTCAKGGEVSRDNCHSDECAKKVNYFFAFQSLGAFFGGMAVVPGMLIVLRSVKPEHRSVSLGFTGLVASLFATLPSPVFWGWIYDSSCLVWPTFCGGRKGACQLYDMDELRIRLHVIYGTIRVISLLSDMWVIYWAKGLVLTDDDEVEKQEEANTDAPIRKPTLSEMEIKGLEEEVRKRTL